MKNEEMARLFSEATPYIQKYHGKTMVVKYGGNAMINEELKNAVMNDLVTLTLLGVRVVLVHGGGPAINEMLQKVGVESHFANGLRVTDDALRETIGGFYGTQWISYIGILFAIGISMGVIGVFVRPHLTNLNRLVAKEIKKSDLLNVEDALVPERRYRIGQLIRALADHDEFHNAVQQQADRFMALYPRLKRGALILGILVPVAFTAVFAVTTTEKVVTLTGWLIWLVFTIAFLLGMELVRDNIQRQAHIDSMSDEELREHLAERGKKVVKELVPAAMSTARMSVPVDRTARAVGVTVPLPPVGKVSDDLGESFEGGTARHDGAKGTLRDDEKKHKHKKHEKKHHDKKQEGDHE